MARLSLVVFDPRTGSLGNYRITPHQDSASRHRHSRIQPRLHHQGAYMSLSPPHQQACDNRHKRIAWGVFVVIVHQKTFSHNLCSALCFGKQLQVVWRQAAVDAMA